MSEQLSIVGSGTAAKAGEAVSKSKSAGNGDCPESHCTPHQIATSHRTITHAHDRLLEKGFG